MSDVKEFAKKNWPYLVGGGIAIIVIIRMNSGGGGGGSDYASVVAAQSAAGQQNAALGMQAAQADRAFRLQENAQQMQYNLGIKTLDSQATAAALQVGAQLEGIRGQLAAQMAAVDASKVVSLTDIARASMADQMTFEMGLSNIAAQRETTLFGIDAQRETALFNSSMQGQVGWVAAQGQAAQQVALGTATMVAQLQAPVITALQTTAAVDIAALQAAGAIGAAGYAAQGESAAALASMTSGILASYNVQTAASASTVNAMFNSITGEATYLAPTGVAEAASKTAQAKVNGAASIASSIFGGGFM